MCIQPMKIRSVNPVAPHLAWIPCGKCEECRNSIKNSWSMRLALELENAQSNGWKVGFCTLTYNDQNLPHFDESAFNSDFYGSLDFEPEVSCFDKKQVRDFIINIRRDLHSDYNTKGLKYMVCSEYGSHTQRPHYHCIFAWQDETICYDDNDAKFVVGCSPENFFALIKKYWKFGYVFPRDLNGGTDSHGYHHQPFLINGTARFAASYAGKYCCKDMDFVQSLKGFKFDKKSKAYKNGDCFHIQNKSLGLSWLVGRSEDELRKYLLNGIGFAGDEKLHQMPLYLRNKIYFSPLYIVERKVYDLNGITLIRDGSILQKSDDDLKADGFRVEYKRLVRRKCTDFFHKNYREIFERKVNFWENTFKSMSDVSTFPDLNFCDDCLKPEDIVKKLECFRSNVSFREIALFYVARYGLPEKYQFNIDDCDIWSMRYTMRKIPSLFDDSLNDVPKLHSGDVEFLSSICSMYLGYLGLSFKVQSDIDKRVNKLKDLIKHMD